MPGLSVEERRLQNKITQSETQPQAQATAQVPQSVTQSIRRQVRQVVSQSVPEDAVVLRDGTIAFTGKQSGVTPTSDNHLATKKYVDDTASNTAWSISDGSTTQAILGGNTLIVADGTAINAVVSATDTLTINNTGVTSNVAGTGIGVSSATGAVTITNSGVTGITGGTAIDASASTGSVTLSVTNDSIGDTQLAYNTGQHLTTSSDVTFDGLICSTINTGLGSTEVHLMNQNIRTNDDVTFANLTTSGDILVQGDDISSDPFASGFTGNGWKIDNTGHLSVGSATIRGTLSVYELLIQQIRASNGAIFCTSSAKVESASGLSASDDVGTITFEDPNNNNICPFADGDIIMMQRVKPGAIASGGDIIKKLVYEVDGNPNGATITVKNAGYDNTSSPAEGDDFVRIGNNGDTANRDGVLYLTSDDTNSPFIDIKASINSYSEWNSSSPKVRLGKLDGITDSDAGLSGSQSETYGLYSDSIYLKGHIHATSGKIGGVNLASSSVYVGSGGYGNGSQTFFLGSDGKFSLKDKLTWDGSTLNLKGTFILENGDSVGAGVTWRGTWNNGVAYSKNDGVAYSSKSYIATQGSTGQTPSGGSSYWDIMADQGATGAQGNTGNTGATGAAGSNGTNGTNGTNGAAGARGSRHYYYSVSGSSWSDSDANTAISNAGDTKMTRDTVTLSKASTFSKTKYWNGSAWTDVNQVVDGNLIVHGTVGADQVDANDIFSENITATNTITGGTIQTASSGQRLVMDGSANNLKFYDSSGLNLELKSIAASSSFGGTQTGIEMANNGLINIIGAANTADIYVKAKNTTNVNLYGPDGYISVIPKNSVNSNNGKGGGYSSTIRCFNAGYDSAPSTNTYTSAFYGYYCKNSHYGAGSHVGIHSEVFSDNASDGEGGTNNSYTNYAGYFSALNQGAGSAYAIYIGSGTAAKSGGGDWSSTSDSRVKTIGSNYTTGLSELIQLQPKYYKYNGKSDHAPDDDINRVGLIAQEAEAVIPSLVTKTQGSIDDVDVDDLRELDTSELKFALINAIKELNTRLTALEG